VPSNGLVGWWPFNGNANDESGNGNNGTVNGATLTIDRFGNANQAYGFDGVDDFIEVINSTQVTLIGNLTIHLDPMGKIIRQLFLKEQHIGLLNMLWL
jgi:hypothetical protein